MEVQNIPTAYSPYTGNTSVVCLVGPDGHGLDNVGDYVGDSYGIYSPRTDYTDGVYRVLSSGYVDDYYNYVSISYGIISLSERQ